MREKNMHSQSNYHRLFIDISKDFVQMHKMLGFEFERQNLSRATNTFDFASIDRIQFDIPQNSNGSI